MRARNAIDGALGMFERGEMGEGIMLHFLPFNDSMDITHEYRVFSAPPQGDIAAVSQYKWHAASSLQRLSPETLSSTIESIMAEMLRIREETEQELGKRGYG